MKNRLVTGGAGFIGSNFVRYLCGGEGRSRRELRCPHLCGESGKPGGPSERAPISSSSGGIYVIRELSALPDGAFHRHRRAFCGEIACRSHILGAGAFIRTNVVGTQVLLDAPGSRRQTVSPCVDDEVYGSLGADGKFTELTPIHPKAVRGKQGLVGPPRARMASHIRSARDCDRCSKNYGPFQFPEKLSP